MVGDPTEESWALMSYGSYLTLTDQYDTRLTRDHPMFVYQAVGSIPTLKGFGSASGRQDIGGLFFLFDALTSEILETTAYPIGQTPSLDLSAIPVDRGDLLRPRFTPPTLIPYP
ncbi:MAG: hypothetical protein MUF87_15415 [Anaerolineae bacterium]|jgi:hypothetical protein|nr:hypothetical protein [Anaerolineae bacterium]